MVTCLNVNPWVYFLLSTAADRKAVIKNVSPGFKSCSTPNWGTFVTRFSEPQFLICKMEMNYGLLHRVVFRIKEDNLCKEWGIVVGASQHSIYVGCWLLFYCMYLSKLESNSECGHFSMNARAFLMTSDFQRPFSVPFSTHGHEIRFHIVYVHHLKNRTCLMVKPNQKSWHSPCEQTERKRQTACLSPSFSPLFFPFMVKKARESA